ncbi:IS3 family transposase [Gloeobacter kilaueensis]
MRRKAFVRTTDSEHGLPVYPNLAKDMVLTGLNQLWISDITYIRLLEEFVYLAVILDRYSRRVIGWALSRNIDGELTLSALRMALEKRSVAEGLVHHSDRGVQYAAKAYVELLQASRITISMSRRANPYDNAFVESFMKTLKYEEVLLNEYTSYREVKENIARFIEEVYNQKRLHSSLGYLPPVEFEASIARETSLTSQPT